MYEHNLNMQQYTLFIYICEAENEYIKCDSKPNKEYMQMR